MKKLAPRTPNAEIIGQMAASLLRSVNLDNFKSILESYGMDEIDPEVWYPEAVVHDIMREIRDGDDAMFDLVSIGMSNIDRDAPKQAPDLLTMLNALPQIHNSNYRNHNHTYEVRQVDDRLIEVTDRTPWPHDVIFGVLWQVTTKYSTLNEHYRVERIRTEFDPDIDDEIGIYHITW